MNDCYIDVPNAFTPDGDNLDDYFFPRQWLSRGVVTFKMSIFNRWGQEIFSTTNINGRGWDGKFNGVDQPMGVFVYIIEAKFKDGTSEKKQGNVTLLR
jgi:gliding motility-associated-like protein